MFLKYLSEGRAGRGLTSQDEPCATLSHLSSLMVHCEGAVSDLVRI